jgi:streptogramin lyase
VYHEGRIYTISGKKNSTTQYLDLKENQWHRLADGPLDYMTQPSALILGKYLYVHWKSEYLCRLDIEANKWEVLKKLPEYIPGGTCTACTDGRRIWVAGSYSTLCYVYDPETDEWEKKASPQFKHENPGLVFHMGLLFLVGGKECEFIEEYNPETNEWTESTMVVPHTTENCVACVMSIETP